MAWPPSLPYPAQSSTCSRPESAFSQSSVARAASTRPPNRLAPPAAAATFRSRSRLNRCSIPSCLSTSSPSFFPLVAGRTDDPHHLCEVLAGIRDAVRRRAAVVDAVAALELEELVAELELDTLRQYDEHIFVVAMGIRILAS